MNSCKKRGRGGEKLATGDEWNPARNGKHETRGIRKSNFRIAASGVSLSFAEFPCFRELLSCVSAEITYNRDRGNIFNLSLSVVVRDFLSPSIASFIRPIYGRASTRFGSPPLLISPLVPHLRAKVWYPSPRARGRKDEKGTLFSLRISPFLIFFFPTFPTPATSGGAT